MNKLSLLPIPRGKKQWAIEKKLRRIGLYFALPCLIGLGVFFVVPFLISIRLSFCDTPGSFRFGGLRQYNDLFKSEAFLLACKNTLLFIAVGLPVMLLISFIKALLMRELFQGRAEGRGVLFTVSLLPMVLPSSLVILLLRLLLDKNGLINTALGNQIEFYRAPYIFWVFVFLYIWRNIPYSMVIFFAGMRAIPQEFFEQAALDGARKDQVLAKIALPLLLPSILFNVIMAVMGVFRLFREFYLLQGAYPDSSVYMLQNFMNNNFYALNYNRLSAASVLFFILLGAGLVLMLRFLRNRDAM